MSETALWAWLRRRVRRRQQVAECNTAMEHPLSQVTTTKICVCVCVRLPLHECQPKPGSNHQDCGTCVCRDSDRNCSSIFAPALIEVWWAAGRRLKPLASSEMDIRRSLMRLSHGFYRQRRVIAMAISMFYFNHFVLDAPGHNQTRFRGRRDPGIWFVLR